MKYSDIRQYLRTLDDAGLLITVDREVDKDRDIGSLVRWQFRGLPEDERKGWLFTNITDGRGRHFDAQLAMAIDGASQYVYTAAMGVATPDQILPAWERAKASPLEAIEVSAATAPVKEIVLQGDDIVTTGGIDQFPVPVLIPGYDVAAYFTSAVWISKDPETGDVNAGTYRVQVKAADRAGVCVLPTNDLANQWRKARALGQPLEAAMVLSPIPALTLCSVSKLPPGAEYGVAGAINGAPLEVVPAETVDLMVPATAEIVVEGIFRTDVLEMEGPFGEFSGFGGEAGYHFIFEVTAITHRRKPILQAFISEFPPSESSLIRKLSGEAQLKTDIKRKVPNVTDVCLYEEGGAAQIMAVSLNKPLPWQVAQALQTAAAFHSTRGKWIIVVDDDIDIRDFRSVMWAMAWRVQPHRDIDIQRGMLTSADPSACPQDADPHNRRYIDGKGGGRILIDATLKWGYPPVALPAREHMERARDIWNELDLPPLKPEYPWFGYGLGCWSEEHQQAAQLAVEGKYLETGQQYASDRIDAVFMDTGEVHYVKGTDSSGGSSSG